MTDKLQRSKSDRDEHAETLFRLFAGAALAAGHCVSDPEYALAWRTDESGANYQLTAWPRRGVAKALVVGTTLTEAGEAIAGADEIDADTHPDTLVDRALDYWIGRKFGRLDDTTFHADSDPASPGVTWAWICAETMLPALIRHGHSLTRYIKRQERRALGDLAAGTGTTCPPNSLPANDA